MALKLNFSIQFFYNMHNCWNIIYYYFHCQLLYYNNHYKITKIVHALWLAKRRVCMRVGKSGCDVKMFCFSCANHASRNLKKFLSWNSKSLLYLPIPSSAETWKIFTNLLCQFFMCSYGRAGWLGCRDLGKRAGNFAIWTLQPGYQDESGMNSGSPDDIVLHSSCIIHIISIPFNCYTT